MIFDILFISGVIGRCDDWRELMNRKSQRSLRCPPFRQVGPNLCFRYHVTAKYSAAPAKVVAENGDFWQQSRRFQQQMLPETATLLPFLVTFVAISGDNLSPFSATFVASVDRPLVCVRLIVEYNSIMWSPYTVKQACFEYSRFEYKYEYEYFTDEYEYEYEYNTPNNGISITP